MLRVGIGLEILRLQGGKGILLYTEVYNTVPNLKGGDGDGVFPTSVGRGVPTRILVLVGSPSHNEPFVQSIK